jgi:hypothetical protein
VHRVGKLRHLRVQGHPLTLPMPASAEDCLRIVRDCIAHRRRVGIEGNSAD